MTATRTALASAGSAVLLACLTAAPSHADDDLPLHHVKYTLTAKNPIYAQIYYLDSPRSPRARESIRPVADDVP